MSYSAKACLDVSLLSLCIPPSGFFHLGFAAFVVSLCKPFASESVQLAKLYNRHTLSSSRRFPHTRTSSHASQFYQVRMYSEVWL